MKICAYYRCNHSLPIDANPRRIYCSHKCKNTVMVARRRIKLKQLAFEYMGKYCKDCGYANNIYMEVFEFHHLEGNKDFGISQQGHTYAWERVRKELDKCVMLCCRCHRIRHAKERAKEVKLWPRRGSNPHLSD